MSKIILALYVLTTSLGLVVLKLGTASALPISYVDHKLQFNLNPFAITGLLLYAISFALYVYLISKFDLGYIIPVAAAFVYILVFIASFVVFKEAFTLSKIIGIALIVTGLIFININSK